MPQKVTGTAAIFHQTGPCLHTSRSQPMGSSEMLSQCGLASGFHLIIYFLFSFHYLPLAQRTEKFCGLDSICLQKTLGNRTNGGKSLNPLMPSENVSMGREELVKVPGCSASNAECQALHLDQHCPNCLPEHSEEGHGDKIGTK